MTTFDRREEAFEAAFAHDEELEFKAQARRAHQVGLWAAGHLGKSGADAENYAQSLVTLDVDGGGEAAIVRKLVEDFIAGGVAQSEHQIRRHMDEALHTARQDVRA